VGIIQKADDTYCELGDGAPLDADFDKAKTQITTWREEHHPAATVVMLDQPTIVANSIGQRPVENLTASPVGRRYGGVQPSSTGRRDMFGRDAPLWSFLAAFGGPADPRTEIVDVSHRDLSRTDPRRARLDSRRCATNRTAPEVQPHAQDDLLR
jgi:predicted RNase H-like nuclease